MSLLGEPSTIFQVGCKFRGWPLNESDPAKLEEIAQLLIKQKPHIKVFAEDNGQDLLLSGEVDIAMEWNGDILQVMAEDDDIGYVVPKEGCLLWEDTLAIPNGAPHPENAHAFIDFVLRRGGGGDRQLHPVCDPERGGAGADAGGIHRKPGDLPAGRGDRAVRARGLPGNGIDRKSTRLNSSH